MKCITKFCKNEAKGKLCNTCRCRKWRENNQMKYTYFNLKGSATRRGKPFTITFEYAKKFFQKTDYMNKKGRGQTGYSIDCKINELGYIPGNLVLLTVPQNSHKGNRPMKKLEYDWMTRTGRYIKYDDTMNRDDLPF